MINQDLIFFDFESTGVNVRGDVYDDFPIEIGMVLCDKNLIIKDIYQSYIIWNELRDLKEWNKEHQDAYKIHKISIDKIQTLGQHPSNVCNDIYILLKTYYSNKSNPILISDNAYFDTFMMHKLFRNNSFPFHYTTWDINLLQISTNTKKVCKHDHTALGDSMNMYHRTLRALEKINYFR